MGDHKDAAHHLTNATVVVEGDKDADGSVRLITGVTVIHAGYGYPNLAEVPKQCPVEPVSADDLLKITHVAIRVDGKVWALPAPARHHHVLRAYHDATGLVASPGERGEHQGFVDASGRYLTREEAFARTGKGRGDKSFSEDLWETPPAAVEVNQRRAGEVEEAEARGYRRAIRELSRFPLGTVLTAPFDDFTGEVIGRYVTREGHRGVVLQQVGTRVVHVYREKHWPDESAP